MNVLNIGCNECREASICYLNGMVRGNDWLSYLHLVLASSHDLACCFGEVTHQQVTLKQPWDCRHHSNQSSSEPFQQQLAQI